jgi:hypothetical protein
MTRTRVRAIVLLGCLALIVASLAGPRQASAQSDQWDALFDRMIRLEHEVKAMQSGGGAVPLNPSAMGSSGAVEDQLRQVMAMLDQIRQTQRSLEMRLERLEGTPRGRPAGRPARSTSRNPMRPTRRAKTTASISPSIKAVNWRNSPPSRTSPSTGSTSRKPLRSRRCSAP